MKLQIILLIGILFISGCQIDEINSFEECVQAGNPVMGSHPRQCTANGETFVEKINEIKEFNECMTQPEVCTQEYAPVCGIVDNDIRCITTPCPSTDAKDFGNSCLACSNGAIGYYEGTCNDNEFIVCQETVTGFDPKEYARDVGGICVDVCPGNYDSYTTQTGIEVCIKHYGVEEISQWETCTRSTQSCNCVKAYETTQGEEIQNPEYRCVPDQYAERLLFRGGQDRLDENGEQSVIIA